MIYFKIFFFCKIFYNLCNLVKKRKIPKLSDNEIKNFKIKEPKFQMILFKISL